MCPCIGRRPVPSTEGMARSADCSRVRSAERSLPPRTGRRLSEGRGFRDRSRSSRYRMKLLILFIRPESVKVKFFSRCGKRSVPGKVQVVCGCGKIGAGCKEKKEGMYTAGGEIYMENKHKSRDIYRWVAQSLQKNLRNVHKFCCTPLTNRFRWSIILTSMGIFALPR